MMLSAITSRTAAAALGQIPHLIWNITEIHPERVLSGGRMLRRAKVEWSHSDGSLFAVTHHHFERKIGDSRDAAVLIGLPSKAKMAAMRAMRGEGEDLPTPPSPLSANQTNRQETNHGS